MKNVEKSGKSQSSKLTQNLILPKIREIATLTKINSKYDFTFSQKIREIAMFTKIAQNLNLQKMREIPSRNEFAKKIWEIVMFTFTFS